MKFDVHRSKYPSSELGALLTTIDAVSHRAAKEAAETAFAGTSVVVVPHRTPSPALDRLRRRTSPAGVTKRDFRRGRR
jgi:hypothetical protein